MRVLMAHNFYQQPGGEDQSFATEAQVLESYGHEVLRYTVHNDELAKQSRIASAVQAVWNPQTVKQLRSLFRENRIDIAHFQNTFPIISPAAYFAARAEGVPVVQSLRNYRLVCANAQLFRDGQICEDCLGRPIPWRGIARACYRGSRTASAVVATTALVHRHLGTWTDRVDVYVALSEFSRQRLVAGGLPAEKIVVKPNFVHPDPGVGNGSGDYALYVGRLSEEKGIRTMLRAWRQLGDRMPLKIVGDGPLSGHVHAEAEVNRAVEWLGHKDLRTVYALMGEARLLIFPSECYETFGRTIVESFAKGTPVLAAALGGVGEMVDPQHTGLLYRAGDAEDLVAKVEDAIAQPHQLLRMRVEARTEFERKYTAARNYEMLLEIYQRARHHA